ncbi:Alkanal monooxygenase alpha chain [Actinoplanes sp. SE50]|uniref:LLM class flavin-dependent oxidoreductase n=1 Tax=unclassified Actinoplanes TaxID=2626549 RepID=UPI00023EBFAB|nr:MULTISPECIES: LLM class flavin-dependent oxidoreductase [unclassified Actinoplanes]AEV86937.1 Alkanal monooxygenase alpha chain [Actinoplanes sp. SE50/110]ATO85333.1 Alkanal monooxygenase alpha chain [Actinoplanes sp. SE50]SLM02744.1 alkanal monooxygenase subunit alpha [Actinoplanes sp. SE50/110]
MRFGLLYHHQLPRPWADDSEERMLLESLEQIELADKLGFDYVWETEHHFMEEYSHSSAPEVFLAAAAARTSRIRLAHGIVSLPPGVNHPVRVAERLATLDLISGGRVDFGTGQGSTQLELEAFGVSRATKQEQWQEALEVVTRLLTESPFTGHSGAFLDLPPRNVVPKPKQKPHPPLWAACSRPEAVEQAARNGLGALSFAFISPEEAKARVDAYYRVIASEQCVPAGFAVNPQFALVLPFSCHEDEEVALDRGLEGAHFFAYSFMHYYVNGKHRPGQSNVTEDFQRLRGQLGLVRDPGAAFLAAVDDKTREERAALRRCIGTPKQLTETIRAYEEAGVDQIIFQAQIGANRHCDILESLELFAAEVLPEFAERRPAREAAKQERLAAAVQAAVARKPRQSADVSDYVARAERPEMMRR